MLFSMVRLHGPLFELAGPKGPNPSKCVVQNINLWTLFLGLGLDPRSREASSLVSQIGWSV